MPERAVLIRTAAASTSVFFILDPAFRPRYQSRMADEHSDPAASTPQTRGQPSTNLTPAAPDIEIIKARFAEQFERIHRLASFQHRGLYGDRRDDAIAETIARTWKAYRDKALAGEDTVPLLGKMVMYAALHVRAENRLAGKKSGDVLSRITSDVHDYHVTSLPHSDDEEVAGEVRDALADHVTGPAEEGTFNADYEAFLKSLTEKERDLTELLRSGLTMSDIARLKGVSNAAVQDMRKTVARKWDELFGAEERGR
jgi:hypothetical protein